jgi:hypothetical protein
MTALGIFSGWWMRHVGDEEEKYNKVIFDVKGIKWL